MQAPSAVRFSASLLVTFFWRDRESYPPAGGGIPAVLRVAKARR
jgi:hypothetical protein